MKKSISMAIAATLFYGATAPAGSYRDAFSESSSGSEGSQIFLGVADVAAAIINGIYIGNKVWNSVDNAREARPKMTDELLKAEQDLASAKNLITYQERQAMTAKMAMDVQKMSGNADYDILTAKVQRDVAEIEKKPVVTPMEKQAAITRAKLNLSSVRNRNLQEAIKLGRVKMIRNVAYAGEAIFILDFAQRVYVFNALDKDPTFSPSLTYIAHKIFPNDVTK